MIRSASRLLLVGAAAGSLLAGASVATAAPDPNSIYTTFQVQPNWGSPQIPNPMPLRYGNYKFGLTHILDNHVANHTYSAAVDGCINSVLDRWNSQAASVNIDGTTGNSVSLQMNYSGTWAIVAVALNKAPDGKVVGIITAYPHTANDWARCAAVTGSWAVRQ
jgi:hypothetical protein